ncbi:MAG: OmpA family protein [Acidobacteria bacterium]|nr:OmpA family protein [Acidobacteriota bacterium]
MPVYRIEVVGRTAKAVNYRHRGGATKIDFKGTSLLPQSRGEAKVESKQGYIEIEVEFDDLQPASRFGSEYLTYVLWAITPEGRAKNLGEILLNGTKSKLNVTTEYQAFGLVVTAEPYFAVAQPSDAVVMENVIRPDTTGKVEIIDAKYELLKRGQYRFDPNTVQAYTNPKVPIELYEARHAVNIANTAGASRYAADTFRKAQTLLAQAESYHDRKEKKPTAMVAREAVQTAEDARLIALQRQEEERLAMERQAAAERETAARLKAEQEARARADAEQQRATAEQQRIAAEQQKQAAEQARLDAERNRRLAEEAAARTAREKADAEAARQAALLEQERARMEAERARAAKEAADQALAQAQRDKEALRDQIRNQLNMILETRESARGLIVNMSDVLFDTAKYTLKPGAREKLAKIAGIIVAHPGLRLEIEGHTDSVGTDEYNQTLSERRASSVRDYLTQMGVASNSVVSRGFGESKPVASNDNAAGRQQNRRVEIVVSGEPVGITSTTVSSLR